MANITSTDMFVGTINIPLASESDTEALTVFIDKYEPQILSEVLGYQLATDVKDAFDAGAVTGVYYDLFNGKEFTDKHGRLNKWPGFLTVGYSPIAFYIYCKWLADAQTYTTMSGEASTNATNAVKASPNMKLADAWNEMVDWLVLMDDFLVQNADDYPDYIGRNVWWYECYGNRNFYTRDNPLGI